MGRVEERMRPGFLKSVAARDVEDQRRRGLVGAQVQVARDERAVPGDVDVLEAVRRQGNHLVVAAAHAGIQIALLVVVLEDDVLRPGIEDGGLEVEVQCRLGMTGSCLRLRQCFHAACLQAHVLADHVVAAHAAWQATPPLALEMEYLAGLLDQIVEHPLLTIPRQRRSAANGGLCTCHACSPPKAVWLVSE